MRRIAAEVGVQAGALYNYTSDKQSLLYDLMKAHMQELLAAWEKVQGRADPEQALARFTRFHIHHHAERPDAVFVSYMELRNLTSENFAEIERLRGAYEAELEQILRAGQVSGCFDVADPRLTSMAIIAMLTGVNTWYNPQGRLSLEQVEAIYQDMVRRMVAV